MPAPEIISLRKEFLGEPTFEWEDIMGNYRKQSLIVTLLPGDKIRSLTAISKLTIITIQQRDEIVCYDNFDINPSPKSLLFEMAHQNVNRRSPAESDSQLALPRVLCDLYQVPDSTLDGNKQSPYNEKMKLFVTIILTSIQAPNLS